MELLLVSHSLVYTLINGVHALICDMPLDPLQAAFVAAGVPMQPYKGSA